MSANGLGMYGEKKSKQTPTLCQQLYFLVTEWWSETSG